MTAQPLILADGFQPPLSSSVMFEKELCMEEESDQKYIDDLILHTKDTIRFLSNEMKSARERCVCAALLRCLGITFSPDQIRTNTNDPPDLVFRSACFEVIELYDKTRKRLDEYRARLKELQNARCMTDTLVPFHPPKPISYQELLDEIIRALDIKSQKYGKPLCSTLDALVTSDFHIAFLMSRRRFRISRS